MAREKRVYAGSAAHFDERRNTSRVFKPNHGAGAEVVALLGRSRSEDWYRWVLAKARGEHLHDARRDDGSPAACPVHGCLEVQA